MLPFYIISALLSIVTVISLSSTIVYMIRCNKLSGLNKELKTDISKKYIKVDYILQNAVIKAYETAKEENNLFEVREYKTLLDTLKGKW